MTHIPSQQQEQQKQQQETQLCEIIDSDELLQKLLSYSCQEPPQEQACCPPIAESSNRSNLNKTSSINLTFLEPNIDLITKFSTKANKNHIPQNGKARNLIENFDLSNLPLNPDANVYLLEVVEQPQQCRMAGYGEKDRRPIDPAPIAKLAVLNCDQNDLEDSVESSFYIAHVSIWSVDMLEQYDIIEESASRKLRFLVGSLVSSPTLLKNLRNEKGFYFAFPDLSVRLTGNYRLKFSLIHLVRNKVITEVFSDPFTVYSAKAYPGMKESSEMSRHLAKQGLKVTVRTQVRHKKNEK